MNQTQDIADPTWQDIHDRDKKIWELQSQIAEIPTLIRRHKKRIKEYEVDAEALRKERLKHLAEIKWLEDEDADLKKDAERYRYAVDTQYDTVEIRVWVGGDNGSWEYPNTKYEADQAIDSAMGKDS